MLVKKTLALAAAMTVMGLGTAAQATTTYSQGFETDASGWNGGSVTRVEASGNTDPALPTTTSGGNYYGVVKNDLTGTNYTNSAYTAFGGKSSTYTGQFTQSLDIYIDADWAKPYTDPHGPLGFVLAMAPSDTSGNTDYGAVQQFRFYAYGDHVRIDRVQPTDQDNPDTIATIATSGWYTFKTTFSKGATGVDPVQITSSIYDASGTLLGSQSGVGLANGAYSSDSSLLGGNGIAWFNTWRNGFADNEIAIDNATLSVVPVPNSAYMALAACGLLGLGLMIRRRRQTMA